MMHEKSTRSSMANHFNHLAEIILPDSMKDLPHQPTEAKADAEQTTACSTLRSRSSSLRTSLLSRGGGSCRSNSNNLSSCTQEQLNDENENQIVSNKRTIGRFLSKMKIRTKTWSRRRKIISEANLRKKMNKYAVRGDWNDVKKLLSNHDFADIPIIPEPVISGGDGSSNGEGKSSSCGTADIPLRAKPQPRPLTMRSPSYGSTRNSFTGKESAAAAAAIKAALFDDGSSAAALSSERFVNVGENLLHDICRCNPPLDVLDTLLTSLRHRQGYTSGKDDMGRTPLHVAAACGASPDVIEALALADPSPASEADNDGRTPLHIAVRHFVYNRHEENHSPDDIEPLAKPPSSVRQEELLDEDAYGQFATKISILKEVMMAYPGKVDFKEEDKMGYSPLDYAIDGNITDEAILHCLLGRKGLTEYKRLSGCSIATQVTQNFSKLSKPHKRSQYSDTSSACSQDLEVLLRLEEEEIAARREKLERMRSRHQKVKIQSTLFDMFGIDQELLGVEPPCVEQEGNGSKAIADESPKQQPAAEKLEKATTPPQERRPSRRMSSRKMRSFRSHLTSSSSRRLRKESDTDKMSMTSDDIYNAHLDAYLNGLADDNLEFRADDDSFDIFHDPEEDCIMVPEEEGAETNEWIRDGAPPIIDIDIQLNVVNDILYDDDDFSQCSHFCRSVVSEVSVPAIFVNRQT